MEQTGTSPADGDPQPETTTYLEMRARTELCPSRTDRSKLEMRRIGAADFALGSEMYRVVGRDWCWIDRLVWSDAEWRDYYTRPDIELWIGYANGSAAGYFELFADGNGNTELAYFGLVPGFIGGGLGGLLLTCAIEKAWDGGARRVWVHTSSRDHVAALRNYQARGFRIYHAETRLTPTRLPLAP
jgi:GNAT superfamily N-acetyltransferase